MNICVLENFPNFMWHHRLDGQCSMWHVKKDHKTFGNFKFGDPVIELQVSSTSTAYIDVRVHSSVKKAPHLQGEEIINVPRNETFVWWYLVTSCETNLQVSTYSMQMGEKLKWACVPHGFHLVFSVNQLCTRRMYEVQKGAKLAVFSLQTRIGPIIPDKLPNTECSVRLDL